MKYVLIKRHIILMLVILFSVSQPLRGLAQNGQTAALESVQDRPFEQIIDQIELKNETIFDAIAILQSKVNIAVSFEMPLVYSKSYRAIPHPRYTGKITGKNVEFVLNWLAENVDSRFIWMKIAGMAIFIAKSSLNAPDYLFEAKMDYLDLKDETEAVAALLKAIEVVKRTRPDTKVFMPIIGEQKFDSKWSVIFKNVTFRQVVAAIAQRLGPSWGWESSAVDDYYRIQFFERYVNSPAS